MPGGVDTPSTVLYNICGRKQSACAHRVLDGSWESIDQVRTPSVEQFRAAWQPIFETLSIKDNRWPGLYWPGEVGNSGTGHTSRINLFINSDAILNRSIQVKNHHVNAAIVRGIRRTGKVLR